MRRAGIAASVTVRGDDADVLVFKNLTMKDGADLCSEELIATLATPVQRESKKADDLDADRLMKLGFKRIECEASGQVFGADLPYVPKAKSPEEEKAKKLEGRRRSMKALEGSIRKNGGTDTIDVRGDDGSIVVFGSPECSDSYLKTWLATMTDLAERFHPRRVQRTERDARAHRQVGDDVARGEVTLSVG